MNRTDGHSKFIRNIIIVVDFMMLNVIMTFYIIHCARTGYPVLWGINPYYVLFCANVGMAISQLSFGTIIHKHYKSIDSVLRHCILFAMSFGFMYYVAMQLGKLVWGAICPPLNFVFNSIFYIVLCLLFLRMVEYLVIKKLRTLGWNRHDVLFVGDAEQIVYAYNNFDAMGYTGLHIEGYYSDDLLPQGAKIDMPHLGTLADMERTVADNDDRIADEIYCTMLSTSHLDLINELMAYSTRNAVQFNYVPSFANDLGRYLTPRLTGELVVFSNLNEPLMRFDNRFVKRTFDIIVSGIVCVCLMPVIPVVGVMIKLSSPGPIFFKQQRTGLDGQVFNVLKFRSMHVNKEADKLQATKDDPRKFAFGNFIRKTNIDELPQFFNVLIGDMSIVGPRPHMLVQTDEYRKKIYDYMLRHTVRPGITGWAQTNGYRGETSELWQMDGRVRRDLWYIQNWSFWLDLRIIFHTVIQMIVGDKNAY